MRKIRLQLFGTEHFQKKVSSSVDHQKRWMKHFLMILSFVFLILALASPQSESRVKVKKKTGSEFFLALDTSLSMLAEDAKPNRFTMAKNELLYLLDRLEGYKVGLIIFAGTSFVQSPLTMDHSAIRFFLESVNTESLPVKGTALKKVIENARKSFETEKGTRKFLILLTDGEDLEGEDPLPEAREASREGMTILALGVGSQAGALIPLREDGALTGYKKDGSGVTVVTRLNDALLAEVAHASQGRYFKMGPDHTAADAALQEIARGGRKKITEDVEHRYESRFQIPLFLALLCLIVELGLSEKRRDKSHAS